MFFLCCLYNTPVCECLPVIKAIKVIKMSYFLRHRIGEGVSGIIPVGVGERKDLKQKKQVTKLFEIGLEKLILIDTLL